MSNKYDVIIIGQGLAGTTLAHIFLQQGQKVLVVDNGAVVTSSKVAAGVWNPVVFRRYTSSFLAQQLIAFNTTFYPNLEKILSSKFYHPAPYYKVFTSEGDVQHWKNKLINPEVNQFLPPEIFTGLDTAIFKAPYHAANVLDSGFLEVKKYIEKSADYFLQNNSLLIDEVNYDAISISNGDVNYKDYTANKIIFCEGINGVHNPWFNKLPFSPAKGELLTIKAHITAVENAIINKGIFIVPLGNDLWKVGATFRWDMLDNETTADALQELETKLKQLLNIPYEIIEHQAAVRPATDDRRPYVGLHPQYPQLGVLNGLGSRGVMLAPYFANQLVQNILHNKPLHNEVDVRRVF